MEAGKRGSNKLWQTITVLAVGVAVGTMLMATPATAHFLPSIAHIWSHIKPKTDARYVRSSATAYAWVNPPTVAQPQPSFHQGFVKNFSGVTSPQTGVYCLTPSAGISVTKIPPIVSVEWGQSGGNDLLAFVRGRPAGICPADTFQVQTYDFAGGSASASSTVSFTIWIP